METRGLEVLLETGSDGGDHQSAPRDAQNEEQACHTLPTCKVQRQRVDRKFMKGNEKPVHD